MNPDPLAGLRDIHLPADPNLWPPAPAVWMLLALAVAIVVACIAWRRRRPSLRASVRHELRRIRRAQARRPDRAELVAELAALVRRTALARRGREAAGVCGATWAEYLAQLAPPGCDARVWQALALGRYEAAPPSIEPVTLLATCRRWLEHVAR